jgi:AraC-like DNA-binding protein
MPLPTRIFSTEDFPPERRAELWRERVTDKLLRIEWEVPGNMPLHANMVSVLCAGDVEIAGLESGPFSLTNTADYARAKAHRCSLHIMTGGHRALTRRDGVEFELRKSMGVMLDEGKAYSQRSDNELTRALILMLPKARILERVPDFDRLIAAPLDVDCEPFRLLQYYLNLADAGVDLNRSPFAKLNADYVVDLVVLSLSGRAEDATRRHTLPEVRYRLILGEIERGIGDPKLSGKIVAARLGITERYLQQLMVAHGETFSHHLLRLRLDKAASLLVSKHEMRIAEIAFLSGFSDLSYFNRSFRKRFGETPRGYRK